MPKQPDSRLRMARRRAIFALMLNILSILIGLVALIFAIPGIVPLLGWLNWIALPIAAVGAIVGMVSSRDTGRNVNIIVFIIAILRLSLGGGIF